MNIYFTNIVKPVFQGLYSLDLMGSSPLTTKALTPEYVDRTIMFWNINKAEWGLLLNLMYYEDLYKIYSQQVFTPGFLYAITANYVPVFLVLSTLFYVLYDLFYVRRLQNISWQERQNLRLFPVQMIVWIAICMMIFVTIGLCTQTNSFEGISLWNWEQYSLFTTQVIYTQWEHFALLGGLILFAIILPMCWHWFQLKNFSDMEPLVLMLSVLIGGCVLIVSANLLNVYISLELMTLSLYALILGKYWKLQNVEAGIKYFFYGGLSSVFFLLGSGCIFFASGVINYADLLMLNYNLTMTYGTIYFLGLLLICLSFFIKFGFFPFLSWIGSVYSGTRLGITIIFALFVKYFYLLAFIKFLTYTAAGCWELLVPYLQFFAVLSIIIASIVTLSQQKIKRLLGFSSVVHLGYMILAISLDLNIYIFYFYFISYFIINLGLWASLLNLSLTNNKTLLISDLNGFYQHYPKWAIAIAIFLFSNIGIPPFLGFFPKFFVFVSLMDNGLYFITFILTLISGISAYYYLSMIKNIFFIKTLTTDLELINKPSWYSFNFKLIYSLAFLNLIGIIIVYLFFNFWELFLSAPSTIQWSCINIDEYLTTTARLYLHKSYLVEQLHQLEQHNIFPWRTKVEIIDQDPSDARLYCHELVEFALDGFGYDD